MFGFRNEPTVSIPVATVEISGDVSVQNKFEKTSWSYKNPDGERDLRVDLLRGLVMFVLVVVHIELFSIYNFVAWERIGVVTGGEGFVILSGIVVGMVYKRRIAKEGWSRSVWKLVDRALQLWRINVAVIFSIALLNLIPHIDVKEIMSFNDRIAGQVYNLFPPRGTLPQTWIVQALLLRIGPHQLQILGLYVCLLMASPLSLYLMHQGRTRILLGLSWILYFYNWASPSMPTGCQFEYGFPLLTWQLLYFHGQAVGFHRQQVLDFFAHVRGRAIFIFALLLFCGFLFWAQNTTNPVMPSYAKIALIPPRIFDAVYNRFMLKNSLGLLRILDDACVLIVTFAFLTRFWLPIYRAIGWFFIPIGQASLYVFAVHVYVVALVSNLLPFGFPLSHPHLWINTLAHTLAFAILWTLVRYKILFRWIPS